MSQQLSTTIAVIGIDIGKNSFHVVACCAALFLIEQSKHKDARATGERSPDNIQYFRMLDVLFPTGKFIQIVRDGRDCAVSECFTTSA